MHPVTSEHVDKHIALPFMEQAITGTLLKTQPLRMIKSTTEEKKKINQSFPKTTVTHLTQSSRWPAQDASSEIQLLPPPTFQGTRLGSRGQQAHVQQHPRASKRGVKWLFPERWRMAVRRPWVGLKEGVISGCVLEVSPLEDHTQGNRCEMENATTLLFPRKMSCSKVSSLWVLIG